MRHKRRILPVLIAVLFIGLGAASGDWLARHQRIFSQSDAQDQSLFQQEQDDGSDFHSTIRVDGQRYQYRDGLKTILFLGVDQSPEETSSGTIGTGGRSDTILLFLLDQTTQTTQVLEISRDTMIEVDVYNSTGDYAYSGKMQLAMQYAFGKTPRISCRLTREKVAELLYGVKIDGCLSLTMDGLPTLVDTLGGLEITFDQDYTYVDPAFIQGTTLRMNGEQAFQFVHYRDTALQGSNTDRMIRQQLVLRALSRQIQHSEDSASVALALWKAADPYLQSDLNAAEVQAWAEYDLAEPWYQVPGETAAGQLHDEFYVDEQALQDLVIQLFYETASEPVFDR